MNDVDLLTWRRSTAELYAAVRVLPPEQGHALWCRRRSELFTTSSQSPLAPDDPRRTGGLPVAPYDPAWRIVAPLRPAPLAVLQLPAGDDGTVGLERVGVLQTPWGDLDAWWLRGYAGGLFVPVKDATAGTTSYGGGRYLLDTVKGADLGHDEAGVVVDLNFLYHPSCAYSPAWTCPLAPAGNVLGLAVPVGETLS